MAVVAAKTAGVAAITRRALGNTDGVGLYVRRRLRCGAARSVEVGVGRRVRGVIERAPAEPTKLLEYWMEWEKGETPPGRVISNLKTGGLKELLEVLVEAQKQATADSESAAAETSD